MDSVSMAPPPLSAQSTVHSTHTDKRPRGLNLLQLRELMLQEASKEASPRDDDELRSAERCQPSGGVAVAATVATPPEDTSGAGQPSYKRAQSSGSLGGLSSVDGEAPACHTPTLPAAEHLRRCSTLESQSSLQSTRTQQGWAAEAACRGGSSGKAAGLLPCGSGLAPAGGGKGSLSPRCSLQPWLAPGLKGKQQAEASGVCYAAMHPPVPVRPAGPHLAAKLAKMCARAVRFLEDLQRPGYTRVSGNPTAPMMPKTALRFAKGLAFVWHKKAGLGAGYTWGRGFVLAQLPGGGWSAPSFLVSRHASLGFTVGYRSVQHCFAIATQQALDAFKVDSVGTGVDVTMAFDMDPWDLDGLPIKVVSAPLGIAGPAPLRRLAGEEGLQPRNYVLADGAMFDLSIKCGFSFLDEATNAALYGGGTTPDQILEGRVEKPPEFAPLYALIAKMAGEAPVVKTTESKYQICKQQSLQAQQDASSRQGILRKARSLASTLSGGGGGSAGFSGPRLGLRRSMTALTGSSTTLHSLPTSLAGDSPLDHCSSPTLFPDIMEVSPVSITGVDGPYVGVGGSGQSALPRQQTLLFGDVQLPPEAWEEGDDAGEPADAGPSLAGQASLAPPPDGGLPPLVTVAEKVPAEGRESSRGRRGVDTGGQAATTAHPDLLQ